MEYHIEKVLIGKDSSRQQQAVAWANKLASIQAKVRFLDKSSKSILPNRSEA